MLHVVEATVLAVGLEHQRATLEGLPIRLVSHQTGLEAIRALKREGVVDLLASRWTLPDMTAGELIERIRAVRPWLPTLVLLDEAHPALERAARRVGAAVIVPAADDPQHLAKAIEQRLGLTQPTGIAE